MFLTMSTASQNEFIEIIIQKRFIGEIKNVKYHSVTVDKVTSSNGKILSVCMRYVNKAAFGFSAFGENY